MNPPKNIVVMKAPRSASKLIMVRFGRAFTTDFPPEIHTCIVLQLEKEEITTDWLFFIHSYEIPFS